MNLKFTHAIVASVALAPLAAQAEGFSYSYLEAGYVEADIDGVSRNADGFAIGGSVELTDQVFMFASYGELSLGPVDLETYRVGGGYAWPVSSKTDIFGTVSYVKAEADAFGLSGDDDGYGLGVGVRQRVGRQFELSAAIQYVDLSDSGDDTSFGVAARWYFLDKLSLGLAVDVSDDVETYGASLRWDFGG